YPPFWSDKDAVKGTRQVRLAAVLIAIATIVSLSLSQGQKPSSNHAKKDKVAKKGGVKPLSKEFRKSALMAKTAWDQLLASLTRNDPKSEVQRYQDEADKADTILRGEQQRTIGDLGASLCLSAKEQGLAINAHTVWYLKAGRAHGRRIGLQKAKHKIANQLERMGVQVRNL